MNKLIHKDCGGEIVEFQSKPEMGDSPALWLKYKCKKCSQEFSEKGIQHLGLAEEEK